MKRVRIEKKNETKTKTTSPAEKWFKQSAPTALVGYIFNFLYVVETVRFLQAIGQAGRSGLSQACKEYTDLHFDRLAKSLATNEQDIGFARNFVNRLSSNIRTVEFVDCHVPTDLVFWNRLVQSRELAIVRFIRPGMNWHSGVHDAKNDEQEFKWFHSVFEMALQDKSKLKTFHWEEGTVVAPFSFSKFALHQCAPQWAALENLHISHTEPAFFENNKPSPRYILLSQPLIPALTHWPRLKNVRLECVIWTSKLIKQFANDCPLLERLDLAGWDTRGHVHRFDGFDTATEENRDLPQAVRDVFAACKGMVFFRLMKYWGKCNRVLQWKRQSVEVDQVWKMETWIDLMGGSFNNDIEVMEMIHISPSPVSIHCMVTKPRAFLHMLLDWCIAHREFVLKELTLADSHLRVWDMNERLPWPDYSRPWLETTHEEKLRQFIEGQITPVFSCLALDPHSRGLDGLVDDDDDKDDESNDQPRSDFLGKRHLLLIHDDVDGWVWHEQGINGRARTYFLDSDFWRMAHVYIAQHPENSRWERPIATWKKLPFDVRGLEVGAVLLRSLQLNQFMPTSPLFQCEAGHERPAVLTMDLNRLFSQTARFFKLNRLEVGDSILHYTPGLFQKWRKMLPVLRHLSAQFDVPIPVDDWLSLKHFETLSIFQMADGKEEKKNKKNNSLSAKTRLDHKTMIQLLEHNPKLGILILQVENMVITDPTIFRHARLHSLVCEIQADYLKRSSIVQLWKQCPCLSEMVLRLYRPIHPRNGSANWLVTENAQLRAFQNDLQRALQPEKAPKRKCYFLHVGLVHDIHSRRQYLRPSYSDHNWFTLNDVESTTTLVD